MYGLFKFIYDDIEGQKHLQSALNFKIGFNTESRPNWPADFYDVSISVDAIIADHQQKSWPGTYS